MIKRNTTIIIFSLIIFFSISNYKSACAQNDLLYKQEKMALEAVHGIQEAVLVAKNKKDTDALKVLQTLQTNALKALHAQQTNALNAKWTLAGVKIDKDFNAFEAFGKELEDKINEWKKAHEKPKSGGDTEKSSSLED